MRRIGCSAVHLVGRVWPASVLIGRLPPLFVLQLLSFCLQLHSLPVQINLPPLEACRLPLQLCCLLAVLLCPTLLLLLEGDQLRLEPPAHWIDRAGMHRRTLGGRCR